MNRWNVGFTVLVVLTGLVRAEADIIMDRSPLAIGGSSQLWWNQHNDQNFAEPVVFVGAVQLLAMDIYGSSNGTLGASATVRIWSDSGGVPATPLHDFTENISAVDNEGATANNQRSHVDFTTPITLSAGTTYWVGMSGTNYDLGQLGLSGSPYDDSRMAEFDGTTFQSLTDTSVGDMAFRLHGVPEPSTFVMLGIATLALLAYAWRRRRRW